jgi:hypothetical protein
MPGQSEMTDWQERVLYEREMLAERISKLAALMADKEFMNLHPEDQAMLASQMNWMMGYHAVLIARIKQFVKDATEDSTQ